MNEPDSFALEEALRLKEKHTGEVIVVSMGPERVKQTIKEALAKGRRPRDPHRRDDAHPLDPLGRRNRWRRRSNARSRTWC